MDVDKLFRIEATLAASEQFAKPMNLSEPPSWLLALLSAVVVVSVIGFLNIGKISRKETVSGIIYQPEGTPKLISPKPGIVQSIAALDGSTVVKGEVLFVIGSEETAPSGQSYSREVESLRLQQADSRVSELNSNLSSLRSNELETTVKIKGLRSQLDQLNADVKLQQQRVEMAEKSLHDVQPLFNSRQLSAFDYRKYETNALDAKQSLGNSRRLLSGAKIDLEKAFAEASSARSEIDSVAAKINFAKSQSSEQALTLKSERNFSVIAPVDGVMTASNIRLGDPVTAGSALGVIVPKKSQFTAELYVPSRAIGFLKVGNEVKLMYDAFPFQRFGFGNGRIRSVSLAPMAMNNQSADSEPVFRVLVSLKDNNVSAYGEKWVLTPGMTLKADLILEERTFFEWLLDPIRSATARI